jgi:divalent metal cation (Fe/Co/Zn/Cd) transporter
VTGESRWARWALRLVALTGAYNVIEAVVALWAGASARSIALVGFGLDSVIELAAAVMVFGRLRARLRGSGSASAADRRARRFVGWTFGALAVYVATESAWTLWHQNAPGESVVGIVLAVASLGLMPALAWGKLRAAAALESRALAAEAKETLACAYLSGCLLLGLALRATLGWWWADPVAALLMVPWLGHEAREALEEES